MGIIFLMLFGATLFVLYIAVRRGWGSLLSTGGSGAILNVLFIVLYALTYEETPVGQALFSGLVAGLGFTAAVVIIASFFRANQPSAEVKLMSKQQQEEAHRDRTNDHPEARE